MGFISAPGPLEILVILAIALIVLGPARLPDAARSVGRGMREFRDSLSGLNDPDEDDEEDGYHAGLDDADAEDEPDEDDDTVGDEEHEAPVGEAALPERDS
jgi:sec-independent protein translocase protein TatA